MMQQIQWNTGRSMSFPAKVAFMVFGIVVLLPIAILLAVAGLLASIVFGILMVFVVILRKIRSWGSRDDGRKNVRVRR